MAYPNDYDSPADRPPPLTRKERLAARFGDWPLIRLLIFSPLFLTVVLVSVLGAVTVALALPKMWRTTPAEFLPEVRVSLLDLWQNASLRRTAKAAEGRGEIKTAYDAWRASWANNLADMESMRGLLEIIPKLDDAEDPTPAAVQAGYWLMRMGGTNTADLELVTRAWVNTHSATLADRAASLLDSRRGEMPENLERLYLMALVQAGRTREFAYRVQNNRRVLDEVDRYRPRPAGAAPPAASGFKSVEPNFEYYCLAYLLGWGGEADRLPARERLREARRDRKSERLAFDLEFITMAHLGDTEACGQLLREMQGVGRDDIRHYTVYWALLVADGRKAFAVQQAQNSNLTPKNGFDAFLLAQAFTQLELPERATELVDRFSENVGWAAELLVLQSDLLIRSAAWDRLRALAVQIRLMPQALDYLGGYAAYLEGLAEWRTGDLTAATNAFQRAVETGIRDARLALKAGEGLTSIGWAKTAQPILLSQEAALSSDPKYLNLLVKLGSYLLQGNEMLTSAEQLYKLKPNDPVAINNYAAALLVLRQRPQEALELTMRLTALMPRAPEMRANFAAALAMVGRYEEAERALNQVPLANFKEPEKAQYYLTAFEIYDATGRISEARRMARLIDRELLYPAQAEWLDRELKALRPESGPSASK